jgi:hypothetical protein
MARRATLATPSAMPGEPRPRGSLLPDHANEGLLERAGGANLVEGALRHQLPPVDDADVGDEPLHHLQHVAGEKDGHRASRHQILKHLADARDRHCVDPLERLIEEEQLRPVDERAGQRQLLLHAVAVILDELAALGGELHGLEQLGRSPGRDEPVEPVELPLDAKHLASGEALEEGQAVRDDADSPLHGETVPREVGAQDAGLPAGGAKQPGEHLHGGALPGAVRPQEAVEGPGRDAQVDGGHGGLAVEEAGQSPGLDRQ